MLHFSGNNWYNQAVVTFYEECVGSPAICIICKKVNQLIYKVSVLLLIYRSMDLLCGPYSSWKFSSFCIYYTTIVVIRIFLYLIEFKGNEPVILIGNTCCIVAMIVNIVLPGIMRFCEGFFVVFVGFMKIFPLEICS